MILFIDFSGLISFSRSIVVKNEITDSELVIYVLIIYFFKSKNTFLGHQISKKVEKSKIYVNSLITML